VLFLKGMCGIAGFVDKRGPIKEAAIKRMAASIAHRGPDGVGWWIGDNATLAAARLAIIDIPGGKQPMFSEDSRWVLVYNGEVYNHLEIRKILEAAGHVFKTRCDTEVVLHAVEEWGAGAVEKFRGVFAFAAWDSVEKKLLLARDRLGIKPLYYYYYKYGFFAFASEVKALLQLDEVRENVRPDLKSIHEIMSYNFPLADRTAFEGIREIRPGYVTVWQNARIAHRQYWDVQMPALGKNPEQVDEEKTASEFLDHLRESVRLRLMSDVPLGVFLSGGLDSSMVAALVGEGLGKSPTAFSISFDEPLWDETHFSSLAASHIGADHHIVRCHEGLDMIPKVIYHLDQPQRWAGTASLLELYKAAKEKVTVVLTGEGADEILAGYPHLTDFPGLMKSAPGISPTALYLARLRELSFEQAVRLYSPELLDIARQPVSDFIVDEKKIADSDPLDAGIYLDIKMRLARFVVFMLDRLSMACGVEARVPFLDYKLLEYVMTLPPSLKLRSPWSKYILRLAAQKLLPKEIVERPKQGFVEPADSWMRSELPELMLRALSPDDITGKGYFRAEEVTMLLEEHRGGKANHGHLLIGIASVQIWHDIFFKGEKPQLKEK